MFGKFASVLAAILAAAVAPAGATTISGTYFEDTAPISCANTNSCQLSFPVLPSTLTGKLVTFDMLNCSINSTQPAIHLAMLITDNGANGRREQYIDPPAGTGFRSFSRPIQLKVTGGPPRQMYLTFSFPGSTNASGDCNLIGTISTQ